jgi:hypothetical protein
MTRAAEKEGPFRAMRVKDGKTRNKRICSDSYTAVNLADLSSPQIGKKDGQSQQSLTIPPIKDICPAGAERIQPAGEARHSGAVGI